MGEMVKDSSGTWRELQHNSPELRPEGAAPDCAYCADKPNCSGRATSGRQFFVGEKNPPCAYYKELNQKIAEDERLKRLKKIFDPVPRPENAIQDCLHCKLLVKRMATWCRSCYSGASQGTGRICENYNEITVRPTGEQQRCIYCLENYQCSRDRVFRIATPCEQYREFSSGTVEQSAGQERRAG
jgi:hypothetical protein